jgi:hypothetical protein
MAPGRVAGFLLVIEVADFVIRAPIAWRTPLAPIIPMGSKDASKRWPRQQTAANLCPSVTFLFRNILVKWFKKEPVKLVA